MSRLTSSPEDLRSLTRRAFLGRSCMPLGGIALASLLAESLLAATRSAGGETPWRGILGGLHYPPRAKRIIHLYMAGGPSHLETFDDKPRLAEMHGKPMPESLTQGQQIAQLQGYTLKCLGPQHPFATYGESGQRICSLFPHLGSMADRLCIINSMHTDQINHDPAHTLFNSGTTLPGRPSLGSWLLYGIGSECQDLPGFVVLSSVGKGGQAQPIAARQWSAGFLPSRFQGVELRSTGDPVLYINNPAGIDRKRQRDVISAVRQLNDHHDQRVDDPEIRTRISQYELAFRMQTSVPELTDLSAEPAHVLEMYGTEGADGSFAGNCLLARRLAERGVRLVQVYHRAWDHHGGVKKAMEITAREVDQASAALLKDLEQRGMLEDTLVLFGGEFGRTPMGQGSGRDHHIKGYSYVLAGGGIKGGVRHGATDELGYSAVENRVHVRDLHATMLYLLGIDHELLNHKFRGLDLRLTGVEPARVLSELIA